MMMHVSTMLKHLEVIADAIRDGANVKAISYGHLWMCSHGLMVMKNVMVYSTLILTHKNVIRKSAYWYKALAESKEIK